MEKINLNVRDFPCLQRISQDKIERYLDHPNYKLRGRYLCVRKMYLKEDDRMIFGKLDSISWISDCLQLHLIADEFRGVRLVTLEEDDVLIFFEETGNENKFNPYFIYWDDKNPPKPGLNLKNLTNTSRLDKFQLEKYLEHPNYKLVGRNAVIRSMYSDVCESDVLGRFVGIPSYGSNHPVVMVNYADGFMSSQKPIGMESENKDNGLVMIIFDKDAVNPEFIYWGD